MTRRFEIDEDIRKASTLPSEVYVDPELYRLQIERVFARSWQLLASDDHAQKSFASPLTLLEGCLDEPVVLTRDAKGARHCLSNVCTHRGNIVVTEAGAVSSLRCKYHGRRFHLDGTFSHMPEFESAIGFPSPSDDLPRVANEALGPLVFASLDPMMSFADWVGPWGPRLDFIPWSTLRLRETKDYEVDAHWALYCDNYLEGFHIPFVHAGLAEVIDYGSYSTELSKWSSLQIGLAKPGEPILALPASHPDAGRGVAAYYAFLFPGTMLNVYPWGVSVNAIRPLGPGRTRVHYVTLVQDESLLGAGAGGDLHRVEMEDEAVVEAVQRGVRSRLYRRGRFSPTRELGVHHFHRLLADALSG